MLSRKVRPFALLSEHCANDFKSGHSRSTESAWAHSFALAGRMKGSEQFPAFAFTTTSGPKILALYLQKDQSVSGFLLT